MKVYLFCQFQFFDRQYNMSFKYYFIEETMTIAQKKEISYMSGVFSASLADPQSHFQQNFCNNFLFQSSQRGARMTEGG